MRNLVSIAMTIAGIATVLTGLQAHAGNAQHHSAVALSFIALACWHAWFNRKALIKRFAGLGWKWAIVGLTVAPILALSLHEGV